MKRILRSDLLPERARWARDFPRWFLKRKFSFWPYNKSLVDQNDCTLASVFLAFLSTSTASSSIKTQKRTSLISSHLDLSLVK